jgi:hypothetical protein
MLYFSLPYLVLEGMLEIHEAILGMWECSRPEPTIIVLEEEAAAATG